MTHGRSCCPGIGVAVSRVSRRRRFARWAGAVVIAGALLNGCGVDDAKEGVRDATAPLDGFDPVPDLGVSLTTADELVFLLPCGEEPVRSVSVGSGPVDHWRVVATEKPTVVDEVVYGSAPDGLGAVVEAAPLSDEDRVDVAIVTDWGYSTSFLVGDVRSDSVLVGDRVMSRAAFDERRTSADCARSSNDSSV